MALGHQDHCRKVEAHGRNCRASELGQSEPAIATLSGLTWRADDHRRKSRPLSPRSPGAAGRAGHAKVAMDEIQQLRRDLRQDHPIDAWEVCYGAIEFNLTKGPRSALGGREQSAPAPVSFLVNFQG